MSTKLLIIGYVWPEPNSSAAGTRIVELISAFKQAHWSVDFACAAMQSVHQIELKELGANSHDITLNCSSFNEWIKTISPDIVIFDRYLTEEQFAWRVQEVCPQALRVIDTEDFHSLRAARECLHKAQQKKPPSPASAGPVTVDKQALYTAMCSTDTVLREVAAIFRSDLSLMISDVEIELLRNFFKVPETLLYHLPFMVTAPLTANPSFEKREHFLVIGNFRHPPNWDAVLWLKKSIWPKIREKLPKAELHIYGAYPPKKATELHKPKEGFLIKGWADDALAVMRDSRVCLAPLRFGAGIKGKLIDAMQTATPSVTTDIGAEAMHGDLPWPGLIENNPEAFAQAAVELYSSEAKWQRASDKAKPLLNERYHAERLSAALVVKLTDCLELREARRAENFIGAMLNHHAHKSTEFMSRWIEIKNR